MNKFYLFENSFPQNFQLIYEGLDVWDQETIWLNNCQNPQNDITTTTTTLITTTTTTTTTATTITTTTTTINGMLI